MSYFDKNLECIRAKFMAIIANEEELNKNDKFVKLVSFLHEKCTLENIPSMFIAALNILNILLDYISSMSNISKTKLASPMSTDLIKQPLKRQLSSQNYQGNKEMKRCKSDVRVSETRDENRNIIENNECTCRKTHKLDETTMQWTEGRNAENTQDFSCQQKSARQPKLDAKKSSQFIPNTTFSNLPKEILVKISSYASSHDYLCKLGCINKVLNQLILKSVISSSATEMTFGDTMKQPRGVLGKDSSRRVDIRQNIANALTHIKLTFKVEHGGVHHKLINTFLQRCQKLRHLEFKFVLDSHNYCPVSGTQKFTRHWMPWVVLIFNTVTSRCEELDEIYFRLPLSFTPHLLTKVNFTKTIKPFFGKLKSLKCVKMLSLKDDSYAICKGGPLLMKSAMKKGKDDKGNLDGKGQLEE